MSDSGLNWSKPDWRDFQKISLFLYQEIHSDPAIEEYLRQGHFQAGIDLLSFRQSTGKHVCIQCKHSQLTLTKLKSAVKLFLVGEFAKTTETFILTTTALLQTPAIQSWITEQKIAFREKHGMAFDVWDRQRLDDSLTQHYRIVEKYFGKTEADDHCFQPAFALPVHDPLPGFITRHIQPFQKDEAEDRWHFDAAPRSTLTLTELMARPADKLGICLIAEAYEGKSSLFRQTAWELSQVDPTIAPLILDLKFCSVLPIMQLLDTNFGTWREVPAKNLVVLIDGLDEVPAEQFDTVAGHIRDFQTEHPAIRTAVSCRKMFYRYQNMDTALSAFEAYELLVLHMRQIFDHLASPLGGQEKAMTFYREMNGLGIADLLGIPFYLIHLTKWFTDTAIAMPKNKIAIAKRFVDESLQISARRKLRSGLSLDKQRIKYRDALEQFALLLQIKGLNACQEDDLQQLFTQDVIDLLTHSSILNIKGDQWSFINAVFQEQLAAFALQKLEVQTVINLITIGEKIKKVSRKWIQTLATYLSLLPEKDMSRQQIVSVIETDNIELLALSEGSKFGPGFRLEVLQKILRRTVRFQARLILIDESDLADFAGNDDAVVDELLQVLQGYAVIVVKVTACRTLRYLKLTQIQAVRYAAVAKSLLIDLDGPDLGRLLLEALAHYRLGDDEFLKRFLENQTLKKSHEFRQGLYQYLASHDLIDDYYDWLLSGFLPLRRYNSGTFHFRSEQRLLDLLLNTRERKLITRLLEVVQGKDFQEQFRNDKDGTKAFYESLTKICAEIYAKDPLIILGVVNYLARTGRHSHNGDPNEMSAFLDLTQTHSLALRIALLSTDKEYRQNYAFSGALNSSCFDDLLYAAEEGFLDHSGFRAFCNGLYYSGRHDDVLKLEQLGASVSGFIERPDPRALIWRKREERKRKNDLDFISSREVFRNAIVRLFEIAGKPIIKTATLHGRFDEDNLRNKIASSYLNQFISWQAEEKSVSLQVCLQAFDDDVYFKWWRGDQLFNGYLTRYYPEQMRAMLKVYYDEEIIRFPFSELNMESPRHLLSQAGQLMKIWAKHQWATSDEILLEFSRVNTEGYGSIHFAKVNKRDSINALLLKHFAERSYLLKNKIIQNLRSGLQNYQVIGTQFEICRELRITEALPFLLDAIRNKTSDTRHEDDYMTLYISLGGDYAELLPEFEAITRLNDYLFLFMVKMLEQVYPLKVIERLLECLQSGLTDDERKIEAAQRLAQMGNQDGFLYIIGKFEAGKPAPFDGHNQISFWNVDTRWGLLQLKPLMFLLLDEQTNALRFHDSPKQLILEILHGFAAKSEADLNMVTEYMDQTTIDLSTQFPKSSGHLSWHAEQMNERYRQINVAPLNNREVRKLFQAISDY